MTTKETTKKSVVKEIEKVVRMGSVPGVGEVPVNIFKVTPAAIEKLMLSGVAVDEKEQDGPENADLEVLKTWLREKKAQKLVKSGRNYIATQQLEKLMEHAVCFSEKRGGDLPDTAKNEVALAVEVLKRAVASL